MQAGKAKRMVIFAKDRDKEFSNDYIYLSFFSFSGISVCLTPHFTEEDKDAEMRKQLEAERRAREEEELFKVPDLPP